MKKLILLVLAGFTMLCLSCVEKKTYPKQDTYVMTNFGFPLKIPKGFFDNENNYLTEKQFEKWKKERQKKIDDHNRTIEKKRGI